MTAAGTSLSGAPVSSLSALLHALPAAVIVLDADGCVLFWSRGAEDLLGWTEEETVGRQAPFIERGIDHLREARGRALEGEHQRMDTVLADKTGRRVDVDVVLAPCPAGEEGRGVALIATDAAERRQAQRDLRRALDRLEEGEAERRQLLARLVGAHERERRLLAADIHDYLLQELTGLALRLEHASLRAPSLPPSALAEELKAAAAAARDAVRRLRDVLLGLWQETLEREGLVVAVAALVERMRERCGARFLLHHRLQAEPDPHTRLLAYRILQEALTNAANHARAAVVEVSLTSAGKGGLAGRVADDGRGFVAADAARPGHLGLAAMRERAEAGGGWVDIRSRPGAGTVVEFFLPGRSAVSPTEPSR